MHQEVAERLGVHAEPLKNWERGIASPTIRQLPRIIELLGPAPHPALDALAGEILYNRRRLGLAQKNLAKALGVNPVTVKLAVVVRLYAGDRWEMLLDLKC